MLCHLVRCLWYYHRNFYFCFKQILTTLGSIYYEISLQCSSLWCTLFCIQVLPLSMSHAKLLIRQFRNMSAIEFNTLSQSLYGILLLIANLFISLSLVCSQKISFVWIMHLRMSLSASLDWGSISYLSTASDIHNFPWPCLLPVSTVFDFLIYLLVKFLSLLVLMFEKLMLMNSAWMTLIFVAAVPGLMCSSSEHLLNKCP